MAQMTDLATAFHKVAGANHYLVKVDLTDATRDDLDEAEQCLIALDNEKSTRRTRLALDMIEHEIRGMIERASAGMVQLIKGESP